MDVESLQWPYSILAAAVLYHTVHKEGIPLALSATGKWEIVGDWKWEKVSSKSLTLYQQFPWIFIHTHL